MPADKHGPGHGDELHDALFEDDVLEDDGFPPDEYDDMLRLEQLESIEEDMMELGVTTLDDVRQRIAELHAQLDERDKRR